MLATEGRAIMSRVRRVSSSILLFLAVSGLPILDVSVLSRAAHAEETVKAPTRIAHLVTPLISTPADYKRVAACIVEDESCRKNRDCCSGLYCLLGVHGIRGTCQSR